MFLIMKAVKSRTVKTQNLQKAQNQKPETK